MNKAKLPLDPDLVLRQFAGARNGFESKGPAEEKPSKRMVDPTTIVRITDDGFNDQFKGARGIHRVLAATDGSDLDGSTRGK